jgi:hypothetical protein
MENVRPFDLAFLASAGVGRRMVELKPKQTFFSQGDSADSGFYLPKGRARISFVSTTGKEATVKRIDPQTDERAKCFAHCRTRGNEYLPAPGFGRLSRQSNWRPFVRCIRREPCRAIPRDTALFPCRSAKCIRKKLSSNVRQSLERISQASTGVEAGCQL